MNKQELVQVVKQVTDGLRAKGLVTALSGGCDSVSLLLLLYELKKEEDFPLWAVHVHHGLREEADKDEAFCRDLCS